MGELVGELHQPPEIAPQAGNKEDDEKCKEPDGKVRMKIYPAGGERLQADGPYEDSDSHYKDGGKDCTRK